MKRLMLVALAVLFVLAAVAPAMGARETFQDWKNHSLIMNSNSHADLSNATVGQMIWRLATGDIAREQYPSASDYCAIDTSNSYKLVFYDSSRVSMYNAVGSCDTDVSEGDPGRIEVKITGGTPQVYCNGVFVTTLATKAYNPSYCDIQRGLISNTWLGNYVFGETDHHAVRALPSNWTVVQDLLDPSATGVYAQNPTTLVYDNLRNSKYFYVDADTDSLDTVYTENLYLSNPSGSVINTTVINSSLPHLRVRYDLDKFVTDAAGQYGLYSVHFQDSGVYSYFTFTANGAIASFDREDYTAYDTATITYSVTPTYWDTSIYSYYIKIVSASTGQTIDTTQITASSGSTTYTFQDDDTNGGYYAVVVATPTGTSEDRWLATAFAQLTQYVILEGYVNSELGTPIGAATVEAVQNSIDTTVVTDATGWYNVTGLAQSVQLNLSATAAGYNPYFANFIPLTPSRLAVNITLNSTTPVYTGLGIGGIVRDGIMEDGVITGGYGRPIFSATVSIANVSDGLACTTTSNIAGWYIFSNTNGCYLQQDHIYAINASKLRFTDSTIYNVMAHGV